MPDPIEWESFVGQSWIECQGCRCGNADAEPRSRIGKESGEDEAVCVIMAVQERVA